MYCLINQIESIPLSTLVNYTKKDVEMKSHQDVHSMEQIVWIPSYDGEEFVF